MGSSLGQPAQAAFGSPWYWRQSNADEAHQLLTRGYLDRLDSELISTCRDLDDTQLARHDVTLVQSGCHLTGFDPLLHRLPSEGDPELSAANAFCTVISHRDFVGT